MEAWRSWHDEDKKVYSEILEEQLEQLKDDEQLRDFRRQRLELKDEIYRPIYHFCRPNFTINDPNGPCFWEGRWHLFYQVLNPKTIQWGHAMSEDLVHWTDLPNAIYPGKEPWCFSGSTCIDNENHRAICCYYGMTGYNLETGYKNGIVLATSSDPLLLNWTKVNDGYAIIRDGDAPCWQLPDAPPVEGQKPYKVFDPCIWKENGTYYILTGGYYYHEETKRRFRQLYLHRCVNDDLLHWEFVKPFLDNDIFKELGDDCACPYFLPIGEDKRLLLHFSHRIVSKYLIGNYDPETLDFKPYSAGRFSSGFKATIAPSGFSLPDGSVMAIHNVPELKKQNGWAGMMTLPRKLTLGGFWKDQLHQRPFADYSCLHKDHFSVERLELKQEEKVILDGAKGNAFEMQVTLKAGEIPRNFEIEVLRSPDGEENVRIEFFTGAGGEYTFLPYQTTDSSVMLDTANCNNIDGAWRLPPEIRNFEKTNDEDLFIQIFVDKSLVEVFVNNKEWLCQRVYPRNPESLGVSVKAYGGNAVIDKLDFWNMACIYDYSEE